ncbi:type 11 methyltransferase [Nitzschia inconspicua]|uniref:Methyltransferase n=1 Tax=Nitzschia inconspicua TaxID=303405 RepID=A0A9K3PNK8_9STRA|nr:type 11 methyltransferase [Nitzschia inconspicua]
MPAVNVKSSEASLVAVSLVGTITTLQLLTEWDPVGRCITFWRQLRHHEKKLSCSGTVHEGAQGYLDLHAAKDVEIRTLNYKSLVNAYYDLATATRRHEYQLAAKLNVTREGHVLDVGCGIGGPMRNIARFLSCKITGLTLNPYQVDRGNEIGARDPTVADKTQLVQGDFMDLPFEPNTFQAAYAIEATCHAPDRVQCYKQVYDVLEPGGRFVLYEWCMTDKFDPNNEEHQVLKKKIEEGNGLPDIITCKECLKAFQQAGFNIVEAYDYAESDGYEFRGLAKPWYTPLMPSWNPVSQRFQFNWFGAMVTNSAIRMLELLRIAPKGTKTTQKYLQDGGFALRDAGQAKIFTTAYFMVGEKPFAT